MEHPLRLDELSPSDPPRRIEDTLPAAAPATPLPPLPSIPASDVTLLTPSDPHYKDYLPAANARKQLSPALRAVCNTAQGVAAMIDWVRDNNLAFAIRCGGHSYEGFSQSTDVVIDLRGLTDIAIDKTAGVVTVGAGVSLYQIYTALAAQGLALQAGSCPTVGISGHLTGGGHGLLARSHGLTCDSLQEATIVDAQSRVLTANATSEPDLYWACRGGGGGSFGVATQFRIGVFPLASAIVFGVSWTLSQTKAAALFAAWQAWAPNAPSSITSIMRVGPNGGGTIMMRCIGQSVGTETELRNQLKPLIAMDAPSRALTVQSLSFIKAVDHFTGGTAYESVYFKAKSDYVTTPLDAGGIHDMMVAAAAIPVGGVVLICDGYGGKIADVAGDATAFVHRAGTQYCIQYYSEWQRASDTPAHLANVAKVYAAMRPHVPGYSYVNYCDLDLPNFAQAYWGDNLPRLMAVKAQYDPQNLFQHAQSVPLPPAQT
jgi:hypothetical protein